MEMVEGIPRPERGNETEEDRLDGSTETQLETEKDGLLPVVELYWYLLGAEPQAIG